MFDNPKTTELPDSTKHFNSGYLSKRGGIAFVHLFLAIFMPYIFISYNSIYCIVQSVFRKKYVKYFDMLAENGVFSRSYLYFTKLCDGHTMFLENRCK